MGQIQRLKNRVVVRFTVEEILTYRVHTSRDVTFTLAELVSKLARMKAAQKNIELPSGACSTCFDPSTLEFVVTFAKECEDTIYGSD